jgi:Right handed beta helix region
MRKPVAAALMAACLTLAACMVATKLARGDPPGDATTSLQAMFDGLKPGATLELDRKTYQHSGVVTITVPNVHIEGNGATLEATNDPTSSVQIRADGVSVSNLNLTAPIGGPRYSANEQHKLYVHGDGVRLNGITITGSAAAGVFLDGANNFVLDRVTVRDSRADGIHMTMGSSNGQINNPLTERTGDDGIAVASYSPEFGSSAGPCSNIVINSPVVNGTTYGQGITVRGGNNITYNNIRVSDTSGAGVFVSTEGAPIFTQSTNNVVVAGGSVNNANVTAGSVMGAVAIYGEHPGYATTDVTVSDLTITNTPPSAERNIAVWIKDGGEVNRITLHNIGIRQQTDVPVIYSDAPRATYTTTGITLNGAPFNVA